jgi:non-specific serine/threonine protein kinase
MIGKKISHYKILKKLGRGGMGVVYKAQDTKLDRKVALKFLPSHLHLDEEAENRFIFEAKAASSFDHPNICTIYDINKSKNDQLFIAMACYEGETLKKKIEKGQIKIEETIHIISQVAEGLKKAHKKGIVHRDIKPANIFITNDNIVKILDFGLAKVTGQTQLTQMGTTVGTIAYLSPEQARGENLDHRTDIWSLGIVLYEMLTGELPFKGDFDQAIIYSILNEEPTPLLNLRSDLPKKLQDIVQKVISKNVDERFQSVDELLNELIICMESQRNTDSTNRKLESSEKYRKLSAIMFTDMVGYSALAQKNELLAIDLLEVHRQLLRPLFQKHRGNEVETIGDAFFVEFKSALEAVSCAVEIQKMLRQRNSKVEQEMQIILRIGLHVGDVIHIGKHVHGDGVNIAARLEPLSPPGGICLSEDVVRQIKNKIELPVRNLGTQKLKNIESPVEIYCIEFPWKGKQIKKTKHASGRIISHYKILAELGRGGMGIVYKATDTKLDRTVAIKFLPRNISANSEERERFKIEAKAAAALNHPNITTIYAIEEINDEMFIVMEYIDGMELKDKINSPVSPLDKGEIKGGLTIEDVTNVATQIAEGLDAAHKKGIVHRDIKSSNIMITNDGKIKIMDFGLAKIGKGEQVTRIGTTIGTVAYMSPEQARGEKIDNRTDIWSFGVVLYEMITGELPFKGDYDQAIIYSILNEEPQIVKKFEGQRSIKKVVRKALKKDREKRYRQIREMIEDLESADASIVNSGNNGIKRIKKLAVLPFANIMNDPQTNFLGFALADQIIGSMAYSKNVLVRPSSTIRKYQNEIVDIQKAGSELNVNYVLAGNYLKESDSIRLNMELVDLESENIIWREPIQIEYNNVFELQDIVSQKVVEGLKIQFSEEERERMKPDAPQNPVAYEFYLHAVAYPHTIEGTRIAIKMLNNSISLDPAFAPAYLELAIRNHQLSQVGKNTSQAFENAEKALIKALSLKNDFTPASSKTGLHNPRRYSPDLHICF